MKFVILIGINKNAWFLILQLQIAHNAYLLNNVSIVNYHPANGMAPYVLLQLKEVHVLR